MKQKILERARSTVEAFVRNQCAGTTLDVLSVAPEVDGDGDEFLWISLIYDDGDAKGLPDSLARIRLKARLRTELQRSMSRRSRSFRSSPNRKSRKGWSSIMAPEHLLQIATDLAEINTRRPRRADLCRAVSLKRRIE